MIRKIVRNIIKESFNLRKKMSVGDVFRHYFKYGDFDGVFIPEFFNKEKLKWLFYQIKSIIDDLRKNNINTGDYLNTSNWGLKQNGDLAMFDVGFGDYFENFDEEPEELDLKENQTLLDKIKTKLNIKDKSQNIGSGMFGWAHDIGNNKVLKITKDKSEAVNSQKIIGKNLKHLANVFDVKKFKTNDKEYYLIILEKLKTDPNLNVLFNDLEKLFDDIRNEHLDEKIIEIIKSKNKDVGNFMEDMYKDGYEKTWEKWRETLYKRKDLTEKFDFNDISEIVSWIKGSKNNFNDIDEIPPDFIIQLVKKLILGKNTISEQVSDVEYIYHGTGKGQSLNIQRDGYMKLNNTGEEKPSISFTKDLDYANYYAKAKGGNNKMAVLRTKLNNDFHLSPRISKNKGEEYITFKKIPSSELEIKTMDGSWKPLNNWNVIFDEPKSLINEMLSGKLHPTLLSKEVMIRMGATGQLDRAYERYIPIDKITGLDPDPSDWTDDSGNVRGFEKGQPIEKSIEVIYDSFDDLYYLQNGNHRIKQAKINGDDYIRAFIQPDRGKIGNTAKLNV